MTVSGLSRIVLLCGVGLVAANCSGSKLSSKIDPKYGVAASPRVVNPGDPVPKGGGAYRVGKPYVVAGKTYVPVEPKSYKKEGLASWYGDDFHGRLTANGEVFDMHSIAAAHPTLPLPSYVRISNLSNGRSMMVRVNDRGPFHGNRLIDVSRRTADLLGFKNKGTARVRVEYVGRAPLEGSDDVQLAATLRENGAAPAPAVMLASATHVPIRAGRAAPAAVPLPPGRPFDLGEPSVAQATYSAPAIRQDVATAPAVAATPQAAPKRVAATAPRPAAAPKPRPVQVADAAFAAPAPVQPAPGGWTVGAQPVMGYAPTEIVTPVGTGRGLY